MTEIKAEYRFNVRLLLKHPTLPPEAVTEALGVLPTRAMAVGCARSTSSGTALGGHYNETTWSLIQRVEGARDFSGSCMELVSRYLEPHVAFLSGFLSTGGLGWIDVQLPGDINTGSELKAGDLARIARLGIAFGVEVFPDEP